MTTLKKKTLYLNTSDIYKGDPNGLIQNHCKCTFPLNNSELSCNNNEKLSISLKKIILPTRMSYLENTGVSPAFELQTTEPASNPSIPSNTGFVQVYISEYQFQPPFIVGNNVAVAVPYYISQNASDLINIINTCLDKFQEGGTDEATTLLEVDSQSGYLRVSGTFSLVIDNSQFLFPRVNSSALFNNTAVKIAQMLGINTDSRRAMGADGVMPPYTGITPNLFENLLNRKNSSIFPVFVSSQGLLIKSNLSLDSFSSIENGVSNVLSNIPTTLKPQNVNIEAEIFNGGTEVMIRTIRTGSIIHQNNQIESSHKTCSTRAINELTLEVVGLDDVLRWCNTNITYMIEVRWLV